MPKKNNIFTIEPIQHERKAKLKCMDMIKKITSENKKKKEKIIKPIESIIHNDDEETIIYANNFFESNNDLQENELEKVIANFSQKQPEEFTKICHFINQTLLEINLIENNNQFSTSSGCIAPPNSPKI